MRRKYEALPADPGANPKGIDKLWTPILNVRVRGQRDLQTPWIHAIVDSGSACSLFHAGVADYIHIDLTKADKGKLSGIISNARDDVYFHRVGLVVEGSFYIMLRAGFMKKLAVAAILGRDFFEHFFVTFDHSKNPPELEITKIPLVQ